MAGAWEIRNDNSTLVGVLHVDTTTVAWALGLRSLIVPSHLPNPISLVTGMPFDHARNAVCQQALDLGVPWLFFLDSDVVPPRDAILRLQAHGQPFVSGVYYRRSPPHGVPVAIKNGAWLPPHLPKQGLIDVDLVGAGCLLIHRDLLRAIPPQRPEQGKAWFDWRVDMKSLLPEGEAMSEDFTLCNWVRKNGYRVLLDPSVVCKHIGYSEAGPGYMKPLEMGVPA